MTEQELREQVALGCRILGANGHDDYVWGHVSVRDPQGRGAWMKASTFAFEEVTADHVILVGFDGEVVAGEQPVHVEWPHGIVTAGKDVPDAVIRAVLLEKAAHQQMLTHAFGGPRRWSVDEEALRKRATVWSERQRAALWDYLARRW